MNKRVAAILGIALAICFGLTGVASAHVLKVDGDIGAILHINPDDNPTTGGSTDYVLSFDDTSGRFNLQDCGCSVSIIENGKTIATKQLAVTSNEVSENHFTFTKPDVYDLRFTGIPKRAGAFQSFTLDYNVRVTDGKMNAQPIPVLLWVGMGMGIGLILLAAYAMNYDTTDMKRKSR